MLLLEGIQFVDFKNLYVIAVGLTMAYIVVEANKKDKASFFSILSSITTFVKEKTLIIPKKTKEQEEAVITQIEYYLGSNLLKESTKGSLLNIYNRATEEYNKITVYEGFVEKKLKFHTKTDFLNVISCDCFLYGLFILFAGAYHEKGDMNINGFVVTLLITIGVLLAHCLIFERLELKTRIRHFKPDILKHVLVLSIALFVGYKLNNTDLFAHISCARLSVLSVIACFLGFIAYLVSVILSNIILSIIIVVKAIVLKLFSTADGHKQEIEKHRSELNEIDKFLSELKMEENLSISSNDECPLKSCIIDSVISSCPYIKSI